LFRRTRAAKSFLTTRDYRHWSEGVNAAGHNFCGPQAERVVWFSVNHFNYHAVPGNMDSLRVFRARVTRLWRRTLLCRSQTHRLPAARMYALEKRWLPVPRVLHPYPEQRFAASHPRHSLHPILKKLELEQGGLNIFRRFRITKLVSVWKAKEAHKTRGACVFWLPTFYAF